MYKFRYLGMLKTLFTSLVILIISVDFVNAQFIAPFTDTVIYYAKSRERVASADSANYVHKILPFDTVNQLYPVVEYYMSGKPKLKAYAKKPDGSQFHGNCLEYFENGRRKSITTFLNGQYIGKKYQYYPNGQMYTVEEIGDKGWNLIECHDITGRVVAKDGEGTWLIYDYDVEHFYISGPVKNGKKTGEWSVRVNGNVRYEEIYIDGAFPKCKFVNKDGQTIQWSDDIIPDSSYSSMANFRTLASGFGDFLFKNIQYPAEAREKYVQGRVFISFIVSEKGVLQNFKILKGIGAGCDEEVIRLMKLSPDWIPSYINGKAVKELYTIPISFNLAKK